MGKENIYILAKEKVLKHPNNFFSFVLPLSSFQSLSSSYFSFQFLLYFVLNTAAHILKLNKTDHSPLRLNYDIIRACCALLAWVSLE